MFHPWRERPFGGSAGAADSVTGEPTAELIKLALSNIKKDLRLPLP